MFKTFGSQLAALEASTDPPDLPAPDKSAAPSHAPDTTATSDRVLDSTSLPNGTLDQPAPTPVPTNVPPQEDDCCGYDTVNPAKLDVNATKVALLHAHNTLRTAIEIPTSPSRLDAEHVPV
jgi:hypothetical protein